MALTRCAVSAIFICFAGETLLGKLADATLALAEAFFRAAPIVKNKRITEAEWAKALAKFHREAAEIRQRYALGFLTRALVAYRFQRRLLAAGFAPDVVRKVVFSVVLNSFTSDQ